MPPPPTKRSFPPSPLWPLVPNAPLTRTIDRAFCTALRNIPVGIPGSLPRGPYLPVRGETPPLFVHLPRKGPDPPRLVEALPHYSFAFAHWTPNGGFPFVRAEPRNLRGPGRSLRTGSGSFRNRILNAAVSSFVEP